MAYVKVLNEVQSSRSGPTAYYTLYLDYGARTGTTVLIKYKLEQHFETSASWSGTGYPFYAVIFIGDFSYQVQIKTSSDSWSGTAVRTFTGEFTADAAANLTSVSTALRIYSTTSTTAGGTLNKTSGSNLSIPAGAPIMKLSKSSITGGATISVDFTAISGQNYKFKIVGETSGITYVNTTTAHSWNGETTLGWASNLISRMSENVNVYGYTYSGSTLLHTQTLTFTYNVPSYGIKDLSHTLELVGGLANNYVQNNSKVRVKDIVATTYYGATLTYTSRINGTVIGTGTDVTSDFIKSNGSLTVETIATDSRGISATITSIINVLPYSLPAIESVSEEHQGDAVNCHVKYAFSSVNGNNKCKLRLYIQNTLEATLNNQDSGECDLLSSATYPPLQTYNAIVELEDALGNIVRYGITILTVERPININASKKGVAIGKASEGTDGLLEVAWDTHIGSQADPVEFLVNDKDIITEDSTANLENVRLNLDTSSPSASGTIDQQITYYLNQLGWLSDVVD